MKVRWQDARYMRLKVYKTYLIASSHQGKIKMSASSSATVERCPGSEGAGASYPCFDLISDGQRIRIDARLSDVSRLVREICRLWPNLDERVLLEMGG